MYANGSQSWIAHSAALLVRQHDVAWHARSRRLARHRLRGADRHRFDRARRRHRQRVHPQHLRPAVADVRQRASAWTSPTTAASRCTRSGSCSRSAASSSSARWSVCSPAGSTRSSKSCARAAPPVIETRPHGHPRLVRPGVHGRLRARRGQPQPPSRRRGDPRRAGQADDGGPAAPPARATPATPASSAAPATRSTSTDLELVNLNAARSIIVLTPQTEAPEDADAYVLKTLLAINRGPTFRDTEAPRGRRGPRRQRARGRRSSPTATPW